MLIETFSCTPTLLATADADAARIISEAISGIASNFTWIDWAVVAGYLIFTTWIGHLLSGKQSTIKDFFLAGRSLPWPAVSGSIIATAISAITFVGVPASVYAANGNWTYLQLAIGAIIARIIVGIWFVRAFYEQEIYSPYDYMQLKLGRTVGLFATLLFSLGAILGQGVRVFATALVLQMVVGADSFLIPIVIIGVFSILWTWMGGMATVIWTDVVQFGVFIIGGVITITFIFLQLSGLSVPEVIAEANAAGKFDLVSWSLDPTVSFTMWAALIAMPFQNVAAYGTDQLNAQRMFCCKGPREAAKAVIWSSIAEIVTIMMLFVGALLFVFYQNNALTNAEQALVADAGDRIYPIYIINELPPGLSGLLIAAVFAAAISSLDSILAALSQTTMSSVYKPLVPGEKERHYVFVARLLVIGWGILLCAMAFSLTQFRQTSIIHIAFSMVSYTYGSLLGMFLMALIPAWRKPAGLIVSVPLSMLAVFLIKCLYVSAPETLTLFQIPEGTTFYFWPFLPTETEDLKHFISWPWVTPIATILTVAVGLLVGKLFENTHQQIGPTKA